MKDYQIPTNLFIHESCRVCDKNGLEDIISLGTTHLTNFLENENEQIYSAPLELVLCNKQKGGCGLLQLRHTVPGDLLYKKFWYMSGVNTTMKMALLDIVKNVEELVKLNANNIVVDIGANDGTLLRCYSNKNIQLVGFEPATNLVKDASVGTTKIINDFFNYEKFQECFGQKKAKIITSIAMFYDLEDPNKFVSDIVKILDRDGIWIIQMNYLATMLENNAFDNIVHEHLEYYSLKSLEYLLEKHNLKIFDVELNQLNGGSIRTYVKHSDCKLFPITDRIEKVKKYEEKIGLDNHDVYHQFATRIQTLKEKTYSFIKNEVNSGKKIYIYGASTRGTILLQFYNLDNKLIKAAADRNPIKWGKKIAGIDIPIISEEQARKENPDYFLILPWYFLTEFVQREKEYLNRGGKFIVPLPDFKIIDSSD